MNYASSKDSDARWLGVIVVLLLLASIGAIGVDDGDARVNAGDTAALKTQGAVAIKVAGKHPVRGRPTSIVACEAARRAMPFWLIVKTEKFSNLHDKGTHRICSIRRIGWSVAMGHAKPAPRTGSAIASPLSLTTPGIRSK